MEDVKMSAPSRSCCSLTKISQLLTLLGVCVVVNSLGTTQAVGGHAPLLGLIGSLAGINIIVLAIWMSDNPTAARAICTRQNLAVLGIVMASSAVTAVVGVGAADAVLCFGLLLLLLVGLVLVMRGVAGA